MKRLHLAFLATLLLPTALWLAADTLLPEPFTYFSFRSVFLQYSGVIAIAVMSVAMLLALRSRWLESLLGGLDRMYRLHKWLGIAALVKRFPYHWFARTHKWIALAYLAVAYHTVVLTKFAYWSQPVGWLVAALLIGGSVAALLSLGGRIGAGHKVQGHIAALTEYPGVHVLEAAIQMEDGWRGHAPGQFAFVTSDTREGAHPYTIASAWNPAERRLVFIAKALGDHTRRLRDTLKIGMPVTVEGPYGCFDFEDAQSRQIWVGAGIGITPFIARMKQRAATPDARAIDLFHPTAEFDQSAIDHLTADAEAAGVCLHLLVDARDGRLNGERIRAAVPDWASASIWFCGPPRFGEALRADFVAHGLPPDRFHQELFEMR
jgi:predicted ferric reductase